MQNPRNLRRTTSQRTIIRWPETDDYRQRHQNGLVERFRVTDDDRYLNYSVGVHIIRLKAATGPAELQDQRSIRRCFEKP